MSDLLRDWANISALHAERVACWESGVPLRYSELDARSNQVARALSHEQGRLVSLAFSSCTALLVASLGVLKSGRVCVPAQFPASDLVWVEETLEKALLEQSDSRRPPSDLPTNSERAYLTQTSGSQGQPKWIGHSHRSLCWSINNYAAAIELSCQDRVAWTSPLGTRASLSQQWGALLRGACLYPLVVPKVGVQGLADFVEQHRITVLHLVPSLWRSLYRVCQHEGPSGRLRSLRCLKLGGEPATRADASRFRELCPGALLVNGLGISEAGGNVTFYRVPEQLPGEPLLPVGFPAPGFELFSLGPDLPVVVRSQYLAQGAWPFEHGWGEEWQSSDVLARRPDGSYVHLGRSDQCLRVAGRQLSLVELEARLSACPGILECTVTTDSDGPDGLGLQAWLVARAGHQPGSPVLAQGTCGLPLQCHWLERLPRLASGKVDVQALLTSRSRLKTNGGEIVRLPDEHERLIQGIFAQVLRRSDIAGDSHFFRLGGDSLLAAEVTNAVAQRLGKRLELTQLQRTPTVAELARWLKHSPAAQWSTLLKLNESPGCPPLFCLPGAGGDVFTFLPLAAHLEGRFQLWGFQHPGLSGSGQFAETVEEHAELYLATLLERWPRGPYRWLGGSAGGTIALEMVRRLVESGRGGEVLWVMMLDTRSPGYPTPRNLGSVRRWALWLWRQGEGEALKRGWKHWLGCMRYRCRQGIVYLHRQLIRTPNCLRFDWRYIYSEQALKKAARSYRPARLECPVLLLVSELQPDSRLYRVEPDLGWGRWLPHLHCDSISGEHGDFKVDPVALEVARRIEGWEGIPRSLSI